MDDDESDIPWNLHPEKEPSLIDKWCDVRDLVAKEADVIHRRIGMINPYPYMNEK